VAHRAKALAVLVHANIGRCSSSSVGLVGGNDRVSIAA
jgi:hypothetical protein